MAAPRICLTLLVVLAVGSGSAAGQGAETASPPPAAPGPLEAPPVRVLEGSRITVRPAFPTGVAIRKVIVETRVHRYREAGYAPPVLLGALPSGVAGTATPEATLLSRVSAMMRGDRETWEGLWDARGREAVLERLARTRQSPDAFARRWRAIFANLTMTLMRRIEYGRYVIFSYQMRAPDGTPVYQGLEFPSVYRRRGGQWYATQDLGLAGDDLLRALPWTSGQRSLELVVR